MIEANKNNSIQLDEILQNNSTRSTTSAQFLLPSINSAGSNPQTLADSTVVSTPRLTRRPTLSSTALQQKTIIFESDVTHTRISSIQLYRVSFGYPSRPDRLVLREVSLTIEPYEITVFVGKSGTGKSSLAGLLCGLYPPTAGYIAYGKNIISAAAAASSTTSTSADGVTPPSINITADHQEYSEEITPVQDLADLDFYGQSKLPPFYNLCGVVEQSSAAGLFSGSIAENIAYGKHAATREEVEEAAMAANAHDFITSFPMKYETEVGPAG